MFTLISNACVYQSIWSRKYVKRDNTSVENAFDVFPNPSEGTINLHIGDSRFANAQIRVTNMLGAVVEEINLVNTIHQLSLTEQGVYFLTITKDGLSSTEKIIIQ